MSSPWMILFKAQTTLDTKNEIREALAERDVDVPESFPLERYPEKFDEAFESYRTNELTVTENGTYKAEDYNVDGFSSVKAEIESTIDSETFHITQNGVYSSKDFGYDGFSNISVKVASKEGLVLGSKNVYGTTDGDEDEVIRAEDYDLDGFSSANVSLKHKVRFFNSDGTALTEILVEHGCTARYPGPVPVSNNGLFIGWDENLENVTKSMDCIALYSQDMYAKYEINDDWETIVANKGAIYPIGSYKKIDFGTVEENGREVFYGTVRFQKVAMGENGTTSTWLAIDTMLGNQWVFDPYGDSGFNTKSIYPWHDSSLRRWLNGFFLENVMPEPLRSYIKPVSKYTNGYDASVDKTILNAQTIDKIWIPSLNELFGFGDYGGWKNPLPFSFGVGGIGIEANEGNDFRFGGTDYLLRVVKNLKLPINSGIQFTETLFENRGWNYTDFFGNVALFDSERNGVSNFLVNTNYCISPYVEEQTNDDSTIEDTNEDAMFLRTSCDKFACMLTTDALVLVNNRNNLTINGYSPYIITTGTGVNLFRGAASFDSNYWYVGERSHIRELPVDLYVITEMKDTFGSNSEVYAFALEKGFTHICQLYVYKASDSVGQFVQVEAGKTYTFSAYVRCLPSDNYPPVPTMIVDGTFVTSYPEGSHRVVPQFVSKSEDFNTYNDHINRLTYTVRADDTGTAFIGFRTGLTTFWFAPKFEEGTEATDWTPSPLDSTGEANVDRDIRLWAHGLPVISMESPARGENIKGRYIIGFCL